MATLASDERNIIEAEDFNWRLVAYPIIAIVALLLIGFGIYYYELNQREQAEEAAAAALTAAKTQADIVKVADSYPETTQAAVALMRAADLSVAAKDFDNAKKDYQRVLDSKQAPVELRDSAQLGLAGVQEANGDVDNAIQSYLVIAQKGGASPFAAVAYHQVAAIYASRQDKVHEQQILQQEVRLGGDSPFVKEAADRLKELTPETAATATNAAP